MVEVQLQDDEDNIRTDQEEPAEMLVKFKRMLVQVKFLV